MEDQDNTQQNISAEAQPAQPSENQNNAEVQPEPAQSQSSDRMETEDAQPNASEPQPAQSEAVNEAPKEDQPEAAEEDQPLSKESPQQKEENKPAAQVEAKPSSGELVAANKTEASVVPAIINQSHPKVFFYGSAECDQFLVGEDRYESKRPIDHSHYFSNINKVVYSIACGGLHTLLLLTSGEVYTLGCNDDGALGRTGGEEDSIPGKVELGAPIDMISAGDSHSIACNSANAIVYQWGAYRNILGGNISKVETPQVIGEDIFKKKKIKKVLSGNNHTLVLADGKVFVWGDADAGILGRQPTERRKLEQGLHIEGLGIRGVENIFTGGSHSFLVKKTTKRGSKEEQTSLLGWGLNNFGQLGNGSYDNSTIPVAIPEFEGVKIKDVTGGEHHTLVLTEEGDVYGFGKNDEGQLGLGDKYIYVEEEEEEEEEEEKPADGEEKPAAAEGEGKIVEEKKKEPKDNKPSERVPRPIKITTLKDVERIFSGPHFNYAIGREQEVYSWGQGDNYILGNREEETVYTPEQLDVNFFKGKPFEFGLGGQHVTYIALEGTTTLPKLEDDVFKVIEAPKKVAAKKVSTAKKAKESPKSDEMEVEKEGKKSKSREPSQEKEKEAPKAKGRGRGRKAKADEMEEEEEPKEEKKAATKGRSRGRKAKEEEPEEEEEDEEEEEEEEEIKKPTRGRSKAKTATKATKKTEEKSTPKKRETSKSKPKAKKETKATKTSKKTGRKGVVGKRKASPSEEKEVKKTKKAPATKDTKSKSTKRGASAKKK